LIADPIAAKSRGWMLRSIVDGVQSSSPGVNGYLRITGFVGSWETVKQWDLLRLPM
jgi:hypothetical protein